MEPKRTYKTYAFRNTIALKDARRGVMMNDNHPPVDIGSPPEFKGSADVWCPEELLVGAVNSCLMLTFLAYAEHRRLEIASYRSGAEGTLERVDGKYRVTRIVVRPVVALKREDDIGLAGQVLKDAEAGCFITDSVIAKVDLEPQFAVEETP